ncbi:hypothetical protein Bca4012_036894 [Brassica carinata]
MCSAFLWSGSPNDTSKAKVAWVDVCCPYEEEGQGIRSVKEGRLIDLTGEVSTQKLGIRMDARICDVYVDGEWRIRNCRDQNIRVVVQNITRVPLVFTSSETDRFLWRSGPDDYGDRFISSETWHQVRRRRNKVIGNLLEVAPEPDWNIITLSSLLERTYDSLTFILQRMVFQTIIYFVWRERNDRKHSGTVKSVEQLAKMIDKTMRNRILSTKYSLKPKLRGLMQRWFSSAHQN